MFDPVNRVLAWYKSYDVRALARRDRGASAVEYTLLLFAVAGGIALLVFILGSKVSNYFWGACKNVNNGVACN
jgi:Flp pilus assembly pilin Flp